MDDIGAIQLSTLFSYLNNASNEGETFVSINSYINKLQSLSVKNSSSIKQVIGRINSLLSASHTRLDGLLLLQNVLSQCQSEVFTDNASTWFKLLITVLQSSDDSVNKQIAYHVTALLLHHSSSFPELHRELATSGISQLISVILKCATKKCVLEDGLLQCVEACMVNYAGSCGTIKGKMENLICQYIDGKHHQQTENVGRCYALLAQCGGAGNKGIKHTEAWSYYMDKLLTTMHNTIDDLFNDFETEPVTYEVGAGETLTLPDVLDKEPQHTVTLQRRFHMMTACACSLLSCEEIKGTVQVPAADILSMMCRCLTLSPKVLQIRPTTEKTMLSAALPYLHTDALSVISGLLKCCGTDIVMYGQVLRNLFLQVLNVLSIKQIEYGVIHPLSCVRTEVYRSIITWLEVGGASCGIDMIAEDLINHCLKDALPHRDSLKLSTKNKWSLGESSTSKRKKRQQVVTEEIGELSQQQKVNQTANWQLCHSALTVIHLVVLTSGCFIKPVLHKRIQEFVIPVLLEIQRGADMTIIPYSHTDCRKMLYHILHTLMLNPHPKWPAPTQCALTLFNQGSRDPSINVSSFCREAVMICECIIHPRAPTLNMPLAVQDLPEISTPSLKSHSPSKSDQTHNLPSSPAQVESSDDEDDSMEYCADGDDRDVDTEERTITKPIQTVDSNITPNVVLSNETTTVRSTKTVNGTSNKNVTVSEEGTHIVTDKEDYYDDLCLAIAEEIQSPEKVPSKDAEQPDGAMKKVTFAEKVQIEPVNNNAATKKTTENADVVKENSKPVQNAGKPDGAVDVVGAKRMRSSDFFEADETCTPAKKQGEVDTMLEAFVDEGPDME